MAYFVWENFFRRTDQEQQVLEALRQTYIFSALSRKELRFLKGIVHVRGFKAGEEVFRQGEVGVGMYVLLKGSLEVYIHPPGDGETQQLVTKLTAGDFLGELSLIESNSRRSATAIAAEDSLLIGFFKPDLFEILDRQPATGVKILLRLSEVLGRRLRETTAKVTELKYEMRRQVEKS